MIERATCFCDPRYRACIFCYGQGTCAFDQGDPGGRVRWRAFQMLKVLKETGEVIGGKK